MIPCARFDEEGRSSELRAGSWENELCQAQGVSERFHGRPVSQFYSQGHSPGIAQGIAQGIQGTSVLVVPDPVIKSPKPSVEPVQVPCQDTTQTQTT